MYCRVGPIWHGANEPRSVLAKLKGPPNQVANFHFLGFSNSLYILPTEYNNITNDNNLFHGKNMTEKVTPRELFILNSRKAH